MEKGSTISIKLIIQLAIFVTIVAGAIIFDCNRGDSSEIIEAEQEPVSGNTTYITYYFNPVKPYDFQTGCKLIPKRLSSQIQNKFLKNLHSIKAYHVLKAESLDDYSPLVSFHFLQFRVCIYSSPDDDSFLIG